MDTYYKNSRKEMMQFIPEHYSRVLEIGCGAGSFRQNLTKKHEYWGVETVESAAKLATTKLDRVLHGTFLEKSSEIPDHYFDLVVCNDVIEHMVDHDLFLRMIRSKISDQGCLVVSAPNVRYIACLFELLVKKDWKYRDEGVLDRTHLRFFTQKSLIRALEGNGFYIENIKGINTVLSNIPVLRKVFIRLTSLILGKDILYLQFGLRSIFSPTK
jgi:2-polyprenyl-3-methyl-5-hydroxy-6-metoxy-1,4-benzoquinol methylase